MVVLYSLDRKRRIVKQLRAKAKTSHTHQCLLAPTKHADPRLLEQACGDIIRFPNGNGKNRWCFTSEENLRVFMIKFPGAKRC